MLAELRIVDLGVIGEASLEPSAGFTAVTGETGAGKTMIVTGLALLAGAKADPRLVRVGSGRALVEGRWQLDEDTLAGIAELGGEPEDGGVLIARQLSASRSRMTVGGAQVPAGVGQQLVGDWVTIHGQSEQLRLGTAERQREVLDAHAGDPLEAELAPYRERYEQRRRLAAELAELTGLAQVRLRELDLLRFGLDEIARVDPQPQEDVRLAAEARLLQSVDDLRLAVHAATVALAGDEDDFGDTPNGLLLVGAARKALAPAVATDPSLAELAGELEGAAAALADVASGLAGYEAGLDADPLRLEWIAGRRAELQSLTRKYGATVDDVLAFAVASAERVAVLDSADTRIAELADEVAALDAELAERAGRISALRRAAAADLAAAVQHELAALAMPRARLEFEVGALPELGPHGRDQVTLLFSANPGSAPAPLARVASGGELSRVRLALEVVLASATRGQTFIFDEVDAGVGGAVALEIGRRLATLAEHSQVIVTHLARVAAFADRHFVVSKADDGQVTTSGVRQVTADERLATLARMMGGLDSSDSALAHARELLERAG